MDKNKDAYGQQVLAHIRGEKSYEIIEREDGFIDISSGPENYFTKFEDWSKIQQNAIKLTKGKVLDIGTGAGRIPLYLQEKGIDVLAIDNSPLAIKVCKERGVKKTKVLPIEKIDVLKPQKFDTILMLGNNFGLFGNLKKSKKLLKKLHSITTENSIIIAETTDPYKTNNPIHLSYQKLNKNRGKVGGQLKIRVRFSTYIGDWFEYLMVSKKEMEEILKNTGWKVEKFLETSKSPVYVAVIKKYQSKPKSL